MGKKDVLYRAVPLIFTTVFFLMIAPIPQLQFMRNVDPVIMFSGTLLLIDGLILILEMFRNLPDAGNHLGAKTGAYLFGILGVIVFLFAIGTVTHMYNPLENVNDGVANLTLTAILGITMVVMYASVHPMVFHHKKNLSHAVRTG